MTVMLVFMLKRDKNPNNKWVMLSIKYAPYKRQGVATIIEGGGMSEVTPINVRECSRYVMHYDVICESPQLLVDIA